MTFREIPFKPSFDSSLSPNYTFPNELRIVSRGELVWAIAESGWFGVNRSKFLVSRDDSWLIALPTLKSLKLSGGAPNQADSAWFMAESGLVQGGL